MIFTNITKSSAEFFLIEIFQLRSYKPLACITNKLQIQGSYLLKEVTLPK